MSDQSPTENEVESLRQELRELRERVADLEQRVENESATTRPAAASEWRDARVVRKLEDGQTVHVREIRELFQNEAGIRDTETLRERTRRLLETDSFSFQGNHRWRYHPGD